MDKQKRLQDEVDKTLEMMDRMESLEAGPYFYTRLESKLRSREREKRHWLPNISQVLDKGLRPILLTLLIVINMISAVFFMVQSKITRTRQEESQTYISTFLEDYSLNRNTYDIDVAEKMTEARRSK
jgi:hypothetical protein